MGISMSMSTEMTCFEGTWIHDMWCWTVELPFANLDGWNSSQSVTLHEDMRTWGQEKGLVPPRPPPYEKKNEMLKGGWRCLFSFWGSSGGLDNREYPDLERKRKICSVSVQLPNVE